MINEVKHVYRGYLGDKEKNWSSKTGNILLLDISIILFFYLNDFHVSSVLTTDLDAQNNGMDMESVRVDSSFPSIPYDCLEPMQRVYPAIMY